MIFTVTVAVTVNKKTIDEQENTSTSALFDPTRGALTLAHSVGHKRTEASGMCN